MQHVLELVFLLGAPFAESRLGPLITLIAGIAADADWDQVIFFEIAHPVENALDGELPMLEVYQLGGRTVQL